MALNPNAQKLVNALRSGEFEQTIGHLHDDVGHCCLGVACEIYSRETGVGEWDAELHPSKLRFTVSEYDSDDVELPEAVRTWLGFNSPGGGYGEFDDVSYENYLAKDNDSGKSFTEIADIIESEPEGLFS